MLTGVDDISKAEDLGNLCVTKNIGNPLGGFNYAREILLLEVDVAEDAPLRTVCNGVVPSV